MGNEDLARARRLTQVGFGVAFLHPALLLVVGLRIADAAGPLATGFGIVLFGTVAVLEVGAALLVGLLALAWSRRALAGDPGARDRWRAALVVSLAGAALGLAIPFNMDASQTINGVTTAVSPSPVEVLLLLGVSVVLVGLAVQALRLVHGARPGIAPAASR